MQITDLETELKMHPLLRLAFRPLFLFGAAFSALAVLVWGLALFGKIRIEPVGNILFWHQPRDDFWICLCHCDRLFTDGYAKLDWAEGSTR